MDKELKEQTANPDLIIAPSGDGIASLSLIDKYEKYIQNNQCFDNDSDNEFVPDDCTIKKEFEKFRNDFANNSKSKSYTRLSTGILSKYRNQDEANNLNSSLKDHPACASLTELIEKLAQVRKCGSDGNSIFCTQEELEAVREHYGKILDFVSEKSSTFAQSNGKDLSTHDSPESYISPNPNLNESLKILTEKIEHVTDVRDRLKNVVNQVNELLDQLELVERYKMESVG